jgi:hypothetical protein
VIRALQQLRTIGAFTRLIASGALASLGSSSRSDLPGRAQVRCSVPCPSPRAVEQFLSSTGGDPELYRAPGRSFFVPPTFFATWALPELSRALSISRLPFNFARVLHAASSVRVHRLHTCEEPLSFVASVQSVQRTGNRVRIDQTLVVTSSRDQPVLTASLSLVIPQRRRVGSRAPELAPMSALPIADLELPLGEGWTYAGLSGDYNPVHWSRTAARLSGFTGPIAHGFDLMTRICHLATRQLATAPSKLGALEVAFRKPVPLPARLKLLTGSPEGDPTTIPLWLAAEPGAVTHLSGRVELAS